METIKGHAQLCHTVLRGKSNEHLFEEEYQKMKLLDVAVMIRRKMDIQVLAFCVLDNELHMIIQLREGQSAEKFLDGIARGYEAVCFSNPPLRVDYLPGKLRFPEVNSSVREQSFFYSSDRKIRHFRKPLVQLLKGTGAALRGCLRLHMLPVRLGIAAEPEDYWWCSYRDYLGRKWLPFTDTTEILENLSHNPRIAEESIRQYHKREQEKIPPAHKDETE